MALADRCEEEVSGLLVDSCGRWNAPEDLVGAVLFLASDEARYVTGQSFYVDGGWEGK